MYPHKKNKSFGQNFLIDETVISNIINYINPHPTDEFLEIGSGTGALSIPLAGLCHSLVGLEIDDKVVEWWDEEQKHPNNFRLIKADALYFDYPSWMQVQTINRKRLVGNLPYNIATVIIANVIKTPQFFDCHFMVQAEVAYRMVAQVGDKNYSPLSIFTQYHTQPDICFIIPPNAFSPAPKVDSALVRFLPITNKPLDSAQEKKLFSFVKKAFSQRRKMLRSSMKQYLGDKVNVLEQFPDAPSVAYSRSMINQPADLSSVTNPHQPAIPSTLADPATLANPPAPAINSDSLTTPTTNPCVATKPRPLADLRPEELSLEQYLKIIKLL